MRAKALLPDKPVEAGVADKGYDADGAKRRRIRTVMQELRYWAARLVNHGR